MTLSTAHWAAAAAAAATADTAEAETETNCTELLINYQAMVGSVFVVVVVAAVVV